MYVTNFIPNCHDIDRLVNAINDGGIVEGMEGIEFSADQLAGEYAWRADGETDEPYRNEDAFEAHLDVLREHGAAFSYAEAIRHAAQLAEHIADDED